MEGLTNKQVISFLKSMGLPESMLFVDGQIANIYDLLGIKPTFHSDGTRMLTPYEIIGVLPKFDDDGKEIPIVFIIKGRCKKIGKTTGDDVHFVAKNKKVRDGLTTLEELKIRYKHAVINGDETEAKQIFELIDSISGGEAKQILSSFFNYTKYYKKLKKQLLMDLFAHFFMLYIFAMVKSAKGGVLRKNKIFKPFRSGEVAMTTTPKQADSNFESVSEVLKPEDFGISNLKSIKIEQTLPEYGAKSYVTIEDNMAKASVASNEVESKVLRNIEQQSSEKVKIKQKPQKFSNKAKNIFSFSSSSAKKRRAFDEGLNYFDGESGYDEFDSGFDYYGGMTEAQYQAMQAQYGEDALSAESMNQMFADENETLEPERQSVLKKKKRVNVKKFGTEYDAATKETKINDGDKEFEQNGFEA